MPHLKEQKKVPEKEFTKMKTSNIPDIEFKTLLIRMLKELKGRIDKLSDNFNKKIKNIKMKMENIIRSQSEMNNTISKMKSTLEGINRVDEMKDRINDKEAGVTENTNQNGNKKKESPKNEDSLRSL